MVFLHLPVFLTSVFLRLSFWLDKRSAVRLPQLLTGILFAHGRRTVTSWFRAAGISVDFRQGYVTVCAVGREAQHMAITVEGVIEPLLKAKRLVVATDDSPTKR